MCVVETVQGRDLDGLEASAGHGCVNAVRVVRVSGRPLVGLNCLGDLRLLYGIDCATV